MTQPAVGAERVDLGAAVAVVGYDDDRRRSKTETNSKPSRAQAKNKIEIRWFIEDASAGNKGFAL